MDMPTMEMDTLSIMVGIPITDMDKSCTNCFDIIHIILCITLIILCMEATEWLFLLTM